MLAGCGEAVRGLVPFQTEFRFLQPDLSIVWTRVDSGAMSDGMAPHGRVETVEGQGFLFSHPLSAKDFAGLLVSGNFAAMCAS